MSKDRPLLEIRSAELAAANTQVDVMSAIDKPEVRARIIETLGATASVRIEGLGWFFRLPDGNWRGPGGDYNAESVLEALLRTASMKREKT
jgi:hypothetical protein